MVARTDGDRLRSTDRGRLVSRFGVTDRRRFGVGDRLRRLGVFDRLRSLGRTDGDRFREIDRFRSPRLTDGDRLREIDRLRSLCLMAAAGDRLRDTDRLDCFAGLGLRLRRKFDGGVVDR